MEEMLPWGWNQPSYFQKKQTNDYLLIPFPINFWGGHLCLNFPFHPQTQFVHAPSCERGWGEKETSKKPSWRLWSLCHFLAEVTQVILWGLAISTFDGSLNVYGLGVYVFQSGIISFLLISISPALRRVCKNILLANWVTLILIATTSVGLMLYVSLVKVLSKL